MNKSLVTFFVCCVYHLGTAFAQSPTPAADQLATPAAPDPILAGEDIRDVRGLVEIPRPPQWPMYSALTAGALALGGLVFWMWRRRSSDTALTAYNIALEELEAARALMRAGSVERFSTAVSDTLRRYIANRFGVTAPRKTTEEFLTVLAEANDSPLAVYRDPLRQFLSACDAAKFAKAMLSDDDMELLVSRAREFLDATRDNGQPANVSASAHPNIEPLTA